MHEHEKLAPESGVEFMVMVSGGCVRAEKQWSLSASVIIAGADLQDMYPNMF